MYESVHTVQLHNWLQRMRAGDRAARDEMLRSVCDQLEVLARKMLRRYPNVQRWAETGDVLQNALLRLLRALEKIEPGSMREFFGLAAQQMRRELLDLARHYYGPQGQGAHHFSGVQRSGADSPVIEAPAAGEDREDLERWCGFHEEVEKLPVEEREVVSLMFYHGWTQVEVGELLQVNERTVRRYWKSAMLKLHHLLSDQGAAPEA